MHSTTQRVLTVTYEALVSTPRTVLPAIMEFIDLTSEESQYDSTRIGDDQRVKRTEFKRLGEPINTASVGRWKTELSRDEVNTFEKIAGKELALYGYA